MPLFNGGRTVEVFQTGTVYWHGRVDEDEDELLGLREAMGIRSQIIVPMDVGGRRQGVLSASSTQPELFSASDLDFLVAAARWVGMIAQRAELVEHITRETALQAQHLVAEQLVTVLAHDLGNHLTPLIGRTFMLQSRAANEGRTADVHEAELIAHGLERLRRLIVDLLDVGRLEQGIFTLDPVTADLAALARESAALLHTPTHQIEVQAPDELLATIDPDRVRQALENLLANALKYTPDGMPIRIRVTSETRPDGVWALLAVCDEGPGIPEELRPHLFERFVQGSRSHGLGLGLYLARGIAEAHGGTITVESTPGHGAIFCLAFPQATS
jgi:signal transduction histidine kinase